MSKVFTQLPSRTIKELAINRDLSNDDKDPVVIGSELVEFCRDVIEEFCATHDLPKSTSVVACDGMKKVPDEELFALAVSFDLHKNEDLPQVAGRDLVLLAHKACARFMEINGYEVKTTSHARDGQSWTPAEEMELEKSFDEGCSMDDLTEQLERSGNAIISRLCKLGRVVDVGDGYKRVEKELWVSYQDLASMKKHTGIKLK